MYRIFELLNNGMKLKEVDEKEEVAVALTMKGQVR